MDPIVDGILKLVNAQGGILTLSILVNIYLLRQWKVAEKAYTARLERDLANAVQQLGRSKSRTEVGTSKTPTEEECLAHQKQIIVEKTNGGKKSKKKILEEAVAHAWAQIHELEGSTGTGGGVES